MISSKNKPRLEIPSENLIIKVEENLTLIQIPSLHITEGGVTIKEAFGKVCDKLAQLLREKLKNN